MKISLAITVFFAAISTFNCKNQSTKNMPHTQDTIFPRGQNATPDHFTGNVWSGFLVPDDSTFHIVIGNVTFEAGARSNWHKHPSGQILLVTNGYGYYQEKGKPKQKLQKGDVIKCLPKPT